MYFYSTDFEYIKGKITNYFDESYLNTYHLYKKSIASFNNLLCILKTSFESITFVKSTYLKFESKQEGMMYAFVCVQ